MLLKLTVKERIALIELIPERGDIGRIKVLRELAEALDIPSKIREKLNIKYVLLADGSKRITFDPSKAEEVSDKEVEISGEGAAIIVESLQALDGNKQLRDVHIELWDKFCG